MGFATDEQVRRWQEHGWVLLPELVPRDEIDAALEDVWQLLPSPEEFHATATTEPADSARRDAFLDTTLDNRHRFSHRPPAGADGAAFRPDQFLGRQLFPFPGSGALNRLTVHDNILDFAERAMQSADLRLYQMGVWAKYTGVTNYEQPMHQDQNHSLVPFRAEPGWWHLEGFLYLTDVDEDLAPTRAVGVADSGGRQLIGTAGPDEAPELYAAEVSAAGPKGSYLAYRPDVFHRGVNLTRPGGARVLFNLSYRLAGQDWIGFENAQARSNSPWFRSFVGQCTPRQLSALGVPEPGHPYWTPAMLDAMAERYPDLDLGPWRDALGQG